MFSETVLNDHLKPGCRRMKKKIYGMTIAMLIYSLFICTEPIGAVEFQFYPRVETGITNYSIKYSAQSETILSVPGQSPGYNQTREKSEHRDDLTYIGGGATLFINRFYIDLSGKYAYDGSDSATSTNSSYRGDEDNFTLFVSTEYQRQSQFDHSDKAFAVGYTFSRNFSVFAGYKWSDTDFKYTANGTIYTNFTDLPWISSSLAHVVNDTRLKYEGPFVGATQGWEIDTLRYIKGVVSVKVGLAFLNSTYTNVRNARLQDTMTDEVTSWVDHEGTKGNTWGFTLGFGWNGNTPINNLTYSLKIGGYRYNFENDDPTLGDISETVLNYNIGISYAF